MALSFVVVCEARADFRTASELADRVFCESARWIEPDNLDFLRSYSGLPGSEPFLTWKRLPALAKDSGLRPRGFIEGQQPELDAAQARRALLFIESRWLNVDGILLIRDDDRLTDRRIGLEQARDASPLKQRVVLTPSGSAGSWRVSRPAMIGSVLSSPISSKNSVLIPVPSRSN